MEKGTLPAEVVATLYRIAQEALSNIAKHAQATSVDIILERSPDNVSLIIEDDGVGFDPNEVSSRGNGGFGLMGMRERAALVGGMVEIESQLGKGATVIVRIPAPAV
jgi:signal transduction histidine kinase